MHVLNNPAHRAGSAVCAVLSLGLLAACSSGGIFSGNTPSGGGTTRMPSNAQDAICEGRADDAVAIMTKEPLASAADRFFVAVAMDEAGHAARSRMLYVNLMQGGSTDRVTINCGSRLLANGTVSGEAARRLAAVTRDMAALDANLRPPMPLPFGLPSSEPTYTVATNSNASGNLPTGPARAVNKPSSQSPLGQWFSHLASYRSFDHAVANRSTLEASFPGLKGIIDQWEVDVNGLAIRLGVRMNSKAEAEDLCGAVKSQGAYCAVMDTSK